MYQVTPTRAAAMINHFNTINTINGGKSNTRIISAKQMADLYNVFYDYYNGFANVTHVIQAKKRHENTIAELVIKAANGRLFTMGFKDLMVRIAKLQACNQVLENKNIPL